MTINVGMIDRVVRVLVGLTAAMLIFVGPLAGSLGAQIGLGVVAVIMIGTSAVKFCPLYRIFGLRTCAAP